MNSSSSSQFLTRTWMLLAVVVEVWIGAYSVTVSGLSSSYLMKVKWAVDPSANNDGSNQKVDTVAYRVGHRGLAEITQLDLYKGMCEQMTGTPVNQAHINQMKRNEDLLKGVHKKPAAAGAAPASQR
jgi:hypothetical protein